VLTHRLEAVLPGLAAEAAVHGDAEVVEVLRRGGAKNRSSWLRRSFGPARCSQSTVRPEFSTA